VTLFDFWTDDAIREMAGLLIANGGSSEVPPLAGGFSKLAFFNGMRLGWRLAGGNEHQLAALDAKIQNAIRSLQANCVALPTEEQTKTLGKKQPE